MSFERRKKQEKLILSDPVVMMDKPVIAGTRITLEFILDKLAAGETIEQILDRSPLLTRDAIHVALSFAADSLRDEIVYPIQEVA